MKLFFILFLSLFILGCSGGGGDDTTETPRETQLPSETINVAFLQTQQSTFQIPLVVILVDFDNQSMVDIDLAWSQKVFGTFQGQLNDYFTEVSNNTFSFIPANENYNNNDDGIIKVTLTSNHPNTSSPDTFKASVAAPALSLANAFIDFSAYDTNGNLHIDKEELQIMFLVAGGELATGLMPGIWAHASCLDGQILDGVEVMQCTNGSYTAFGERHSDFGAGGTDATIGIIAHELGHGAFYLPDLYDTDGSSEGIGNFGLMGSGSWGFKATEAQGETPVHMSAWSKYQSGFLTESTISIASNNIAINETGFPTYQALKIKTQEPNEYFLIENRSTSGYDAGMYSLDFTVFQGGLAIWHIDESQLNNVYPLTPNSVDNNRLVDLEEADSFHLDTNGNRGDQTNLFYAGNSAPLYTGVLTPTSTPANSNLYSGASTNISISNVSASSSIMYIDLNL